MQPEIFKKYAGLILAAGASSRMDAPKPLLKLGGGTLLGDQVRRLNGAGCSPVIVVCGAAADKVIETHQGLNVEWVLNADWETGSFSSLKAGITALPQDAQGCLVLPVDTAGVPAEVFRMLLSEAAGDKKPAAVIPTLGGRGGHPVWISKNIIGRIKEASTDSRLDFIMNEQENVVRLEVGAPEILRNLNTPEEWSEFLLQKSL